MHFPHQIVISQTTTYAAFLWKHKAFSNADKLSFVSIQELTEDHRLILEDLSTANAKKYQSFSNLVFEAVSPDAVKRIIGALARSSIKCRSLIVVGQDSTPESAAAAFSIASEEKLCSDVGFHDAQPDTIKAALSIKNFSMRRLTLRRLDLDSVQVAIEAIPTEISELGFYDLQRSAVIRALSVISDKQKSQLKQMGICGDTEASEVIINFAFKLPSLIGCVLYKMPANLQTAAQQYFEQAQNNNPTSKLKLTVMAIPAVPMETPAKLYSGPIHLWSHADAEKPETEATNVQRANSVYPVSSLKI